MDAEPSTPPAELAPTGVAEELKSDYVPLEELVTGLVVENGQIIDDEIGLVVTLDKVATEFPIELRIERGESGLRLTTAPPTQHIETTILPVWHQLRVTVVRNAEDDEVDAAR